MKLVTYRCHQEESIGMMSDDLKTVIPLHTLGIPARDMNELIDTITPEQFACMKAALPGNDAANGIPVSEVELLAPIPVPRQDILCLGINYMEHAVESARYKKEEFNGERPFPVYFSKRVNECTPDGGIIDGHFDIQNTLDYEVELGVILGKTAKNVKAADALDYVFGYTIINDVSARMLQTRHKQFYFAKSLDTFTCMGPWIVTADEFDGVPDLEIQSRINGELRQNSRTSRMIFDIPYVIEEQSAGVTLKAGTVIATGTPSGVGMGFTPPKWLQSGDIVECKIEKIGTLTNRVQ